MWRTPQAIIHKLEARNAANNKVGEGRNVSAWEKWIDHVYTLRILTDAENVEDLKTRATRRSNLAVQRFHAEIYDEICKQYAVQHNVRDAIPTMPAEYFVCNSFPMQYSLGIVAGGEVIKRIMGTGLSSADTELINDVLADIIYVFSLFDINIITLNDLYTDKKIPIERAQWSVDTAKRPFIANRFDATTYPPPLYDIFTSTAFNFATKFDKVHFDLRNLEQTQKDYLKKFIVGSGAA